MWFEAEKLFWKLNGDRKKTAFTLTIFSFIWVLGFNPFREKSVALPTAAHPPPPQSDGEDGPSPRLSLHHGERRRRSCVEDSCPCGHLTWRSHSQASPHLLSYVLWGHSASQNSLPVSCAQYLGTRQLISEWWSPHGKVSVMLTEGFAHSTFICLLADVSENH